MQGDRKLVMPPLSGSVDCVGEEAIERSPAPLSSIASTLHAIDIFSRSSVLCFQSSSALQFLVRVSAAVVKNPFYPTSPLRFFTDL
ncbi:hypothetical protein F2Q68_00003235 [Brassica cretica]|uniref:Uncharacterized protein n=1 Tax=Brassica cretica TaxID=69181 RepID=A0A8S9JPA8_BRACR|nr:hypothetical protein F2Q68_00003235 [Brassica cretica]